MNRNVQHRDLKMNTNKMTALSRRGLGVLFGSAVLLAAVPGVAQDKKKFALVQINQQALFFNQMNEGAQKAADAAGVELVIFNANNDPAAQNSAIETYIQEGVDGIAIVAIDVNLVGSGVTEDNIVDILARTNGVIVASSLKVGGVWWNPVEPDRVKRFVERAATGL